METKVKWSQKIRDAAAKLPETMSRERYRIFAVLVTGLTLSILLLMHHSLLLTVTVVEENDPSTAVELVTCDRSLQGLLHTADVHVGPGDAYEWSGILKGARANLTVYRAFQVHITGADGTDQTRTMTRLAEKTVADVLEDCGISMGEDDYTEPSAETQLTEATDVIVHRVDYRTYDEVQDVPFQDERVPTSLFFRKKDKELVTQEGEDGQILARVTERWVDGELEERSQKTLETIKEAQNQITKVYGEGAPVSDLEGPPIVDGVPEGYTQVLTGRATGYSASATAKGAAGIHLTYGTCAVNPNVIPYGTKMYIVSTDGNFVYGYCIAADTGTAMMEGRVLVDLYYETYEESVDNAVWEVNVYIVPDGE